MAPTLGDYKKLENELAQARSLIDALRASKEEGKPWYKSKGVNTGLAGVIIGGLSLAGVNVDLSPEQQVTVVSGIMVGVSALSVIFRAVARTVVTMRKQ